MKEASGGINTLRFSHSCIVVLTWYKKSEYTTTVQTLHWNHNVLNTSFGLVQLTVCYLQMLLGINCQKITYFFKQQFVFFITFSCHYLYINININTYQGENSQGKKRMVVEGKWGSNWLVIGVVVYQLHIHIAYTFPWNPSKILSYPFNSLLLIWSHISVVNIFL